MNSYDSVSSMTSLFLYQIDYNLKVNVKYGLQTLNLKDQIFCLQFSFRFVLELAERKKKKKLYFTPCPSPIWRYKKSILINDKKNTHTIHYAVTICNKPSYYIYWRFFLNKKKIQSNFYKYT